MGEYATYSGKEIKIGTCEDLYYLRADQRGRIQDYDLRGGALKHVRFRFPWPDEDKIPPGGFEDFNRSLRVPGYQLIPEFVKHYSLQFASTSPTGYLVSLPCPESDDNSHGLTIHKNGYGGRVHLVQQKFIDDGRLVPVLMCGGCGAKWRIEDRDEIIKVAESFSVDAAQNDKKWGILIAQRILEGAGIL